MFKRIVRKGARAAARGADLIGSVFGEAATFLRTGPRNYVGYRRSLRIARKRRGATFANGVTTALTPDRARGWHRVHWKPVVVVLSGPTDQDVAGWIRRVHPVLRGHYLVERDAADALVGLSPTLYSVAGASGPKIDLAEVWEWMHRQWRRWDLVLLDASQPLPDPSAIIELQHAAHEYHRDDEIGFVTPAYRGPDGTVAGYDVDRSRGRVVANTTPVRDYGQSMIPRYVLTAAAHGFYATSAAVDRVDVAERHLAGLDLDAQVGVLVRRGWASNHRTLCLSSTVVPVRRLPQLALAGEQERWLTERRVADADGRTRIVFVLNATSVSGGIRAVFEIANGLARRGFEVDIWSLQGTPTWFDLHVPVRQFRTYDDLLLSLRNVDAIKVATWWETAEVVWLSSVSHGIPVYLIQEFETWFYPDDPIAQAAVVASYRREFASLTEASYQVHELADVGVDATLIPHGYDSDVFHVLPEVTREPATLLALGRSFFQKNFAMTLRAWHSLAEERPQLLLFGAEPQLYQGDRIEYHERPRDEDVNVLYNRGTVFVQTSRHEGFCLPILEAMAAGCPVITTDSHGNRDFCVDGENCVIVGQDDDRQLAAEISRLMSDPAERERLSRAGLATAERYRWSTVLDSVAGFYAGLAEAALPAADEAASAAIDLAQR